MVIDYEKAFREAIKRLGDLSRKRDEINDEIAKTMQFARATINLLPDDKRRAIQAEGEAVMTKARAREQGLSAAIRKILEDHTQQWMSVAVVRDRLKDAGFDFSAYSSNPLSSVSTTLKRLTKSEENIESLMVEGVQAYRWFTPIEEVLESVKGFKEGAILKNAKRKQ
jgi:hypothetical protein